MCGLTSGLGARGLERVLAGWALGGTGSAWDSSGDADEAARLSRSSRRRFSFLPGRRVSFPFSPPSVGPLSLTIVSLSNAVLDATTFC